MLQLKQKTGQMALKYNQNQSTRHNSVKQLSRIDTNYNSSNSSFLSPSFEQREKQLLLKLSNLENQNSLLKANIKVMNESHHQLQRFRHLLSIKQRVIESQQQEIDEIKKQLQAFTRKYVRQSKGKPLQLTMLDEDVDELSGIDHFQTSQIQQQKQSKGNETKRKICLKKNGKNSKLFSKVACEDEFSATAKMNIINQQQLLNLRNYVCHLKLQIQMLKIEKVHWQSQAELITKRQAKLKNSYNCLIHQQSSQKMGQIKHLNQQKQLQNGCNIQQLNSNEVNRLNANHFANFSLKKAHQNPPITPHFSNSSFIFPHFKKGPKNGQDNDTYDQIFEAQSESTQQDYFQ